MAHGFDSSFNVMGTLCFRGWLVVECQSDICRCESWYHWECVAITTGDERLNEENEFICPPCVSYRSVLSQICRGSTYPLTMVQMHPGKHIVSSSIIVPHYQYCADCQRRRETNGTTCPQRPLRPC